MELHNSGNHRGDTTMDIGNPTQMEMHQYIGHDGTQSTDIDDSAQVHGCRTGRIMFRRTNENKARLRKQIPETA